MNLDIIEILPTDESFKEICEYLEREVVNENLSVNGGTLNYSNLTYDSDLLLVAMYENEPIGYISLLYESNAIYVYQMAVKKIYQQKGIGSMLMKKTIEISESKNLDIKANVMDYNTNSKKMITKLGFVKFGDSWKGNGYYRYFHKDNNMKL